MSEERRREIILGILDLISEYKTNDFDIDFPEDSCRIHITLEQSEI